MVLGHNRESRCRLFFDESPSVNTDGLFCFVVASAVENFCLSLYTFILIITESKKIALIFVEK